MKPKQTIVHLPVYQPGKPIEEVKRELGLTEVIKLASNENPFGSSPKARAAIEAEIANISLYPDGGAVELTEAVAEYLGVNTNQLIFGAGSDEVILMLARAFLVQGDETVMATHTFPQYKHNCEIEGAVSIEVPLKDGTHDLDGMLAAITDRTKIVWICNPNNPTGTMNTDAEIKAFLAKVPEHVLVVLDEAYCEYNTTGQFPDSIEFIGQYRNVIALRTFSKIYGLASLRIGYGVGHPDVIRSINQVREPFNTTRFAQAAALAAIKDQDFIASCREANTAGLNYLTEQFNEMGLQAFPAHGNFIMVNVGRPAGDVFNGLLRRGIIVRGGHMLGFPTSLRVTIGSREQNEKFIAALQQVLAEVAVQA
ncbi:histidinol-phosphate transaminase [Paenibacillus aceris]|uniref:Histidinol-phosphate aminotransferase n=1 Tax=Paenibacillus aceris TaxID=869555 RepID=A0ABS4HTJ5_9BACL|nr:histidinol-phosphate transaminase [Paenibacillus aceris]MBP1961952.1 histidinol-phosphate aminotransferase [Paenibacillus aceris]NHW34198.1 histidinol-phosphate transaminase [Paenibacillus aceris]